MLFFSIHFLFQWDDQTRSNIWRLNIHPSTSMYYRIWIRNAYAKIEKIDKKVDSMAGIFSDCPWRIVQKVNKLICVVSESFVMHLRFVAEKGDDNGGGTLLVISKIGHFTLIIHISILELDPIVKCISFAFCCKSIDVYLWHFNSI